MQTESDTTATNKSIQTTLQITCKPTQTERLVEVKSSATQTEKLVEKSSKENNASITSIVDACLVKVTKVYEINEQLEDREHINKTIYDLLKEKEKTISCTS